MLTAEVSGALLGAAYELHANALLNRSFGGVRCVLMMLAGGWVAKKVCLWDQNAQLRKEVDKERKEMHDYPGKFGTGSWY